MVADYMSKPLQGKLFVTFRNVLMGWAHLSTLFDIFSPTEECVEKRGNLAVGPKPSKPSKLTYAEAARVNSSVEAQNHLIGNGGDPVDEPLTRLLNPLSSLNNVDIKVK
jgi:hypothetical protein